MGEYLNLNLHIPSLSLSLSLSLSRARALRFYTRLHDEGLIPMLVLLGPSDKLLQIGEY
jgi:hypothetical protein